MCGELTTKEQVAEMAKDEQVQIVGLMTNNIQQYRGEITTVAGFSGLALHDTVRAISVNTVNWAKQHGGVVGENKIEYGSWLNTWRSLIEQRGAMCGMRFSLEVENTQCWQWMNDKFASVNGLKNVLIGGNAADRGWILSILYLFMGEQCVMSWLQEQEHMPDGARLLYNILQGLKIGTMQHNLVAMDMITQYVEALVQGHYCHWTRFGSIETGFKIVMGMVPAFVDKFKVEFDIWSKCPMHGKFRSKALHAPRLCLYNAAAWDDDTGDIECDSNTTYQCFTRVSRGGVCQRQTTKRVYTITSPIYTAFMIQFDKGVPVNLWLKILDGDLVSLGGILRQIGGGIFKTKGDHYVAAELMINRTDSGKSRVWIKFDTVTGKVVRFAQVKRTDCKVLFILPPEKSCHCGAYDDEEMVDCPNCYHWSHPECVEIDDQDDTWDGTGCGHCVLVR